MVFNEEEWGIASLLDLLICVLKSLSNLNEKSRELIESSLREIFDLAGPEPRRAIDCAKTVLASLLTHNPLLLVCENLIDILGQLSSSEKREWKEFIDETQPWVIVSTSTHLSKEFSSDNFVFKGYFDVHRLSSLDFDQAVRLATTKAQLERQDAIVKFLSTPIGRARFRAVHYFAGGNPRIYIVMSDILGANFNEESGMTNLSMNNNLTSSFLRMADDLTPYYQDRMRQLAPLERKVTEFLCRSEPSVRVSDIARHCLASPQTASKTVCELVEKGLVKRKRIGRESYCEITEPLMRLVFEVKDRKSRDLHYSCAILASLV